KPKIFGGFDLWWPQYGVMPSRFSRGPRALPTECFRFWKDEHETYSSKPDLDKVAGQVADVSKKK
uniref:Uncharacterized protein n=1 Tax=Salvator merianae TaxID=96440 RepID=A0A8D0E4F7_SALMN